MVVCSVKTPRISFQYWVLETDFDSEASPSLKMVATSISNASKLHLDQFRISISYVIAMFPFHFALDRIIVNGGVAEWLRCSVSNHA